MRLTGWRYVTFIGTIVGFIGTFCYFTMISPMINPEPYKQIREGVATESANKRNIRKDTNI
ncbi:uncharacterized protein LOC117210729 [Bombus bifarius]|uniref:Uncharacterized protein LOC117210729 n=1 Tax=Bombus bifarius TaxID=103933 RepID=A0A6P8N5K6_9HYME|nr:uncharacterized protein LOC117157803 [Bombus vancouverensis nearcticus]XP_033309915.1 uncharacterized protein LOC117210729 [Bombus bifarius]